ncbi:MAG: glycosyl transferase [Pseudanabaena sp.]|nr:MAG: glycosyl transferase [Pseudanabaena sp.]
MLISIVLPAYNEAQDIANSLNVLRTELPSVCLEINGATGSQSGNQFEVIVVNDGSADRTGAIVQEYMDRFPSFRLRLINLPQNYGKGYAVKIGVAAAKGAYIAYMDADLSTPLQELPKLISIVSERYLANSERAIAIGSRALTQSKIIKHQPLYRELMGKTFNLLVHLFVIRGIYDTQCGFKVFRASEAKQIFKLLQTNRFSFDVEVLLLAQHLGIAICEVPVTWQNSPSSSVSPIVDSWEMFYTLASLKYRVKHNLAVPVREIALHGN